MNDQQRDINELIYKSSQPNSEQLDRTVKPEIEKAIKQKIKEDRKNQGALPNRFRPLVADRENSREPEKSPLAKDDGQLKTTRQRQQKINKRVSADGQQIEAPRLAQERPKSQPIIAKQAAKKGIKSMAKLYLPIGSVIGGGAAAGIMNWLVS